MNKEYAMATWVLREMRCLYYYYGTSIVSDNIYDEFEIHLGRKEDGEIGFNSESKSGKLVLNKVSSNIVANRKGAIELNADYIQSRVSTINKLINTEI